MLRHHMTNISLVTGHLVASAFMMASSLTLPHMFNLTCLLRESSVKMGMFMGNIREAIISLD